MKYALKVAGSVSWSSGIQADTPKKAVESWLSYPNRLKTGPGDIIAVAQELQSYGRVQMHEVQFFELQPSSRLDVQPITR